MWNQEEECSWENDIHDPFSSQGRKEKIQFNNDIKYIVDLFSFLLRFVISKRDESIEEENRTSREMINDSDPSPKTTY